MNFFPRQFLPSFQGLIIFLTVFISVFNFLPKITVQAQQAGSVPGFAGCDFSEDKLQAVQGDSSAGTGLIVNCIRDIIIFVIIISIFIGSIQIVIVGFKSYFPGSSFTPEKEYRKKLVDMFVGLPLMGASIGILLLINPAATNLDFLDFEVINEVLRAGENNNSSGGGSGSGGGSDSEGGLGGGDEGGEGGQNGGGNFGTGGSDPATVLSGSENPAQTSRDQANSIFGGEGDGLNDSGIGGDGLGGFGSEENPLLNKRQECIENPSHDPEACGFIEDLNGVLNDLEENTFSPSPIENFNIGDTIQPLGDFPSTIVNDNQFFFIEKTDPATGQKTAYEFGCSLASASANYCGRYSFLETDPNNQDFTSFTIKDNSSLEEQLTLPDGFSPVRDVYYF